MTTTHKMTLHDRIVFAIRDRFPDDHTIWTSADDLAEAILGELHEQHAPGGLRVHRWISDWELDQ
jgi:hypothetical protein